MSALRRFLHQDDAATAVEYAVMLALIVITCLVAIRGVGGRANALWTNTKTEMEGM
jgi:pilus assembly protein Flp/PilA